MKKSIVTLAMAIALNMTALSTSILSTPVYASEDTGILANSSTDNDTKNNNRLFQGMGIGAITGTLVAGPAGLIIGGLIGTVTGAIMDNSLVTDGQTKTDPALAVTDTKVLHNKQSTANFIAETAKPDFPTSVTADKLEDSQLAQTSSASVTTITDNTPPNKLPEILTSGLRFDVYFQSGSDNIENFYQSRLAAIAKLLKNTHSLDIHLDGYTDRLGNKEKNIALAKARIHTVRQKLIDNGINQQRIISTAFGEKEMLSSPDDISTYPLDRKVEIYFERIKSDPQTSIPTTATNYRKPAVVAAKEAPDSL